MLMTQPDKFPQQPDKSQPDKSRFTSQVDFQDAVKKWIDSKIAPGKDSAPHGLAQPASATAASSAREPWDAWYVSGVSTEIGAGIQDVSGSNKIPYVTTHVSYRDDPYQGKRKFSEIAGGLDDVRLLPYSVPQPGDLISYKIPPNKPLA